MDIKRILTNKPFRRFSALLFVALIMVLQHSCNDSLDNNKVSDKPINTAIIGISGNPGALFGNACDESVIQVNTELVPDGTPIDFEITFSNDLPPVLRGCLFGGSLTVEGGVAFVNYLSGVLIGINELATVNIAVTVRPIDGDEESDFITITLEGVGIIPPDNQDITVPNPMDAEAQDIFLTLIFNTIGIKPGTLAEVSLSNPDIGLFNGGFAVVEVPVSGSVEAGEFVVQYNPARAGGTQIMTARIFLEVPPELAAFCPIPPPEDLVIEATVVITQSVEEETPPTPGP
ncbi:MAG: hypothetical protein RIG61_02025 [Deltaproteobacteria bacterium]